MATGNSPLSWNGRAMSWQKAVDDAQKWVRSNDAGFTVADLHEEARRIDFASFHGSFHVTVPETPGDEWMVWSEDESCVQRLSESLEYMSQPKRKLTEILDRAAKVLRGSSGALSQAEESRQEEEDTEEDDEEEEEEDAYDYDMEDPDVDPEPAEKKHRSEESEVSADDFFTGQGSAIAVHRLVSDLKSLHKSEGKFGIRGGPRSDNLFIWDVELGDFDPKILLYKDLQSYAHTYKRKPVLQLEMKFPKDYPMCPPFVRIIRPRFQFLTGHVTMGGSICMELLTRSGWLSTNDIEGILIQVRAEIMSDPRARLAPNPDTEYSEGEARSAFERMVLKYGWNRTK